MGVTVILSGMPHYVTLNDLAYNLDKLFGRNTIGTFRVRELNDQHSTRQIEIEFLSYYDARTAQVILDGYKYELPSGKYTLKAEVIDNPEYLPKSQSPKRDQSSSQNGERENWKALAVLPSISDGELYRASARLDAQLELLRKQKRLVRKERKLLKEKRKLDYEYKMEHSHSDLDEERRSSSRGRFKRSKQSRSQSRRRSRSRHSQRSNCTQRNPRSAERPKTKWPAIMPDASVTRLPYRSRSPTRRHSPRNRSRSPLRAGASFSRNFETVTADVGQCRSRTRRSDDRTNTSRATATATQYDHYCYNNKLTSSESSTMSEAIREAARCLLADKHLLQETINALENKKNLEIGKKTILKRLEEMFVDRLEKITWNRRSMSVHDIIMVYNKCFTKTSEELLVTRLCSELNYLSDISIAKDSEVGIVVDEYSQRDSLKTGIDNAERPIEQENIVIPESVSEGNRTVDQKIEIMDDASVPLLDRSDSTFWVVVDEVLEDVQPNTLKPGETIERTATHDNVDCNIEINENVTPPVNKTAPIQKNNTRRNRGKKNKKNRIKGKPKNKYPMFNMIVQILYKQMKKHTTMLDPKIKEKLMAVASERLRMRLRNMLKGSNEYLHSSHIIMLYRKLYPIEGDEQFVNEVVNDIRNGKYRSILDNQELGNSWQHTELAKENQTPNTIWNPTIQAETTIEAPSDISKENAVDNVTKIPPVVPASETDYTLDDDVILVPDEVEVITISDNEGEYDARVEVAAEPVREETQSEAAVNPTVEAKGTPDHLQTLHVVSNTNNSKSCGYNKPSAVSVKVHIDEAEIEIKTSEYDHSFPKTVNSNIAAKITSGDKAAKVCNLMSVPEKSVGVPQSQDKSTDSEHDKNKDIIQENAIKKQANLDVATDRNYTHNCEAYVSTRPVDSDSNTENVVKTEHNVPTEDIVKEEPEPEESVESIKNFIELISKIVDLT